MEHRILVPTFGILAAALTSVWISPQASAGNPSGMEGGSANTEIMANESAEARVTVVAKTANSSRHGSEQDYLGVGFGLTTAPLEPLPILGEYISSLIVMARPSPLAAATPSPTAAAPRVAILKPRDKPAAMLKPRDKPAAKEPEERLSWLRLPWWRR